MSDELPSEYRSLLWTTFFKDRGRGFSLEDHFPPQRWNRRHAKFAWLQSGAGLVAGLMVRELMPAPGSSSAEAAAVGLVCVTQSHRGLGLSKRLFQASMAALESQGLVAFTLWTGKPAVYLSQGFAAADHTLLAWVSGLECEASLAHWPIGLQRWPDAQEQATLNRGLPPFALGAQRLTCSQEKAWVILVVDPMGLAVAEWAGPEASVANLLSRAMPPRWRLHAHKHDALLTELRSRGARLEVSSSSLQMWRGPGVAHEWTARYPLRLLDRI